MRARGAGACDRGNAGACDRGRWARGRLGRSLSIILALATLLIVLPPAHAQGATAGVRFIHLSPDTPLVDVLIAGRPAFRNIGFVQRSPVVTVPAGQQEVRVYPHRPPRRTIGGEEGTVPTPAGTLIEPVVTILNLAPGSVTTLALTGAYEPPVAEEWRGYLSIQVDPPDAEIVLEGPRGYRAVLEGDQFIVGLEPGPYRAVVHRTGYVTAEYETEIAAGTTGMVSISLQEADNGAPDARPATRSERQGTWHGIELQRYSDDEVPLAPPGFALVRFVNAAPTVPDLDIEGRPDGDAADERGEGAPPGATAFAVSALRYPNASAYHAAAMHPYLLDLRVAGTASRVHAVPAMEFTPGATYTIFVSADPLTNQILLVSMVDAIVPQRVLRTEEWP